MNVSSSNYQIKVQGGNGISKQFSWNKYKMIVGTCESLQNITGRTNCVNATYVMQNLAYLEIDTKQLSQFFDFNYFNHPHDGAKKN